MDLTYRGCYEPLQYMRLAIPHEVAGSGLRSSLEGKLKSQNANSYRIGKLSIVVAKSEGSIGFGRLLNDNYSKDDGNLNVLLGSHRTFALLTRNLTGSRAAQIQLDVSSDDEVIIITLPRYTLSRLVPFLEIILNHGEGGNIEINEIIRNYIMHLAPRITLKGNKSRDSIEELFTVHLSQLISVSLQSSIDINTSARTLSAIKLHGRAMDYVRRNIEHPQIGPARIAHACGISVSYLHKLFSTTGKSVNRSIMEERLALCGKRLRDQNYRSIPITMIAYDAGFNNPAHFSSCFRKMFGMAPREYRARMACVVG